MWWVCSVGAAAEAGLFGRATEAATARAVATAARSRHLHLSGDPAQRSAGDSGSGADRGAAAQF